ncbi:RDD family protein [Thalassotalea euphylliae]|uniref:RDD family protein n=1 Tax=Thalassotalea euphylliae TaxID=1655234 RepID=UPI00363C1F2D
MDAKHQIKTTDSTLAVADSVNAELAQDAISLSKDETRQILTPFAFEIDKSLFGLPLASPYKRAAAIAVDGLLVAMLSSTPGEILAIFVAIALFRFGSNKRAEQMGRERGRKRRFLMRLVGAFTVFVVLAEILPKTFNDLGWSGPYNYGGQYSRNDDRDAIEGDIETSLKTAAEAIVFSVAFSKAVAKIDESDCQTVDCWYQDLTPAALTLNELSLPLKDRKGLVEEAVGEIDLSSNDREELASRLSALLIELPETSTKTSEEGFSTPAEDTENDNVEPAIAATSEATEKSDKPVYSVIELAKALIEDLGLGFGWAAFYFTVFTSVYHGKTPGKKLFGIRVIQLDGTPLSMWDSFGRYGGYGAGIATGLLGFIQIFWDANRQAIHDQISATVVIDTRKAKQQFEG